MQIAVPTLILLAAIIPGVAVISGYFAGKFPRELASLSALDQLVLYVLYAAPLDAFALTQMHHVSGGVVASVLRMLDVAPKLPPAVAPSTGAPDLSVAAHWLLVYSLFILGCVVLGVIARRLVWVARLDLHWNVLRLRPDWYYILQGRARGLPRRVVCFADVLVARPGGEGSRLYTGVVEGFETGDEGCIRELILSSASRYSGQGADTKVKPIPGDRFIVLATNIENLNLRYFAVRPPAKGWKRTKYRAWGLFRSFFFEEP